MGLIDYVRSKNLGGWAPSWVRHRAGRRAAPRVTGPRHLLFAFCDHWEPLWKGADDALGDARVEAWRTRWPELASRYRDADGCHPQHSFFFPGEPDNATDPVLNAIPDPQLRERLILKPARHPRAAQDAESYLLDIVLQGEGETPFFVE